MKVIDLLNKIANGEEVPKKIKCNLIEHTGIYNYTSVYGGYVREDINDFLCDRDIIYILNNEVEIIEDTPKIPEKIDKENWWSNSATGNEATLKMKVNEIIDYLKEVNDD